LLMLVVLGGHGHSHGPGEECNHGEPDENGSINLSAAYIHVLGDLIQTAGVILAAVLIWWEPFDIGTFECAESPTGTCSHWNLADPITTISFAFLVMLTTYKIVMDCISVLMQKAPANVKIDELISQLLDLNGVLEVHDLHVWALTMGKNSASCHIVIGSNFQDTMTLLRSALKVCEANNCQHATIQIEEKDIVVHHSECSRTSCLIDHSCYTKTLTDPTLKKGHSHGHDNAEHDHTGHGHGHEHGHEHGHKKHAPSDHEPRCHQLC